MATFSLLNCTTYCHGYDLTTDTNKATITPEAEELDVTCFGSSGYRSRAAGLKDVEIAYEGFMQDGVGTVGPELFPDLGTADRVFTVIPGGPTETNIAYLFQAGKFSVQQFGGVGEIAPFSVSAKGTHGNGLIRGQLAAAKQNKSGTGVLGSVLNLGAPTSTQFVYATLHLIGTAATTITVQIQSDDSAGMGTPTTRATIGPLTTSGGTWLTRVAGPFAGETHWRMNISAITGTWSVAGAIAVQ